MNTSILETSLPPKNFRSLHHPAPDHVMKNRGRSFYFASRFLDQTTAERAARLYEFCRAIDDIADRSTSKNEARDRLDQTLAELKGGVPPGKLTQQLFLLAEDTDLDPRAAIELVKGCRSDLSDEVLIQNEEQLIQYCYQVAGSVGIMMCAVLGVKDPRAIPHAIDLGIGMQLTNITRDISEDARSERRYLPTTFVGTLSCTEILSSSNASLENICEAVDKIVNLADRYYKSGREGFCFLPATSRQAIAIAASVYRQIGIRVRDNTEASLTRRAVVPQWEKLVLASAALLKGLLPSTAREMPTHDPALHQAIRSYPGANPEA